jgi:hypothetical protein
VPRTAPLEDGKAYAAAAAPMLPAAASVMRLPIDIFSAVWVVFRRQVYS